MAPAFVNATPPLVLAVGVLAGLGEVAACGRGGEYRRGEAQAGGMVACVRARAGCGRRDAWK